MAIVLFISANIAIGCIAFATLRLLLLGKLLDTRSRYRPNQTALNKSPCPIQPVLLETKVAKSSVNLLIV